MLSLRTRSLLSIVKVDKSNRFEIEDTCHPWHIFCLQRNEAGGAIWADMIMTCGLAGNTLLLKPRVIWVAYIWCYTRRSRDTDPSRLRMAYNGDESVGGAADIYRLAYELRRATAIIIVKSLSLRNILQW